MGCECSCFNSDDCETSTLQSYEIKKARKIHRCCECNSDILPGQKYEYAKGLANGSFWNEKTCITCVRIRDDFCPSGFYYGELRETIRECLGFDYITGKER